MSARHFLTTLVLFAVLSTSRAEGSFPSQLPLVLDPSHNHVAPDVKLPISSADTCSLDIIQTVWPVVSEAENFTASKGGWSPMMWGDNYYSAGFSNTFASRKAMLHASANASGSAVSPAMHVPTAGTWYLCVRYEAAYRFQTQFTVQAKQGSSVKLNKLFGTRAAPKLWAFGWSNEATRGCKGQPAPECHWSWGATENWVWVSRLQVQPV
jgi:hypothetical protein